MPPEDRAGEPSVPPAALHTAGASEAAPHPLPVPDFEAAADTAPGSGPRSGAPGRSRTRRRAADTDAERLIARRVAAVVEGMAEAFLALDAEWRVVYVNREACRLNGTSAADLIGRDHWARWPETVGTEVEWQYRRVAAERVSARFEHHYPAADVWHAIHAYPAEGGGIAVFYRDMTPEKRAAAEREALLADARAARAEAERAVAALAASEARFRHLALHDPLTGLGNRALFLDRIAHALARAARDGAGAAVLYVDLDGFKSVNDARGHAAGDRCLRAAAERLRQAVRAGDTVARLGGDEFGVLLEGAHPAAVEAEAVRVAERVERALRAPVALDGAPCAVTASVGVAAACVRDGGPPPTPDEILGRADAAMYAAKARGGGGHHLADQP